VKKPTAAAAGAESTQPLAHNGLVLATLILAATVANLNLAVANVALPSIASAFDASQTALNLVAVGYSLGLASSVLYLGAVGDRYGRKLMLVLGTALAIPASLLAGFAPTIGVLFVGRLFGGLAAGMAFPTTLALITALWSGPQRTKAIALWSGIGGSMSALGQLLAGVLLVYLPWGSVFLVSVPLAAVAALAAWRLVPSHVNETTDPVDNLGGILSVLFIAALVLSINFVSIPSARTAALGLMAVALASVIAFVIRQRRAASPLFDLQIAGRRIFWVAACAGIIVFGTLMAALFIGQQYLQDVLGYPTLQAGASILPAAILLVIAAPISARLVESRGSRFTLLAGYFFCFLGFIVMMTMWTENASYLPIGLAYGLVGIGVGLAGTPASHSLTGSVPVRRAGMASGTSDLQRDLGGAIMQSLLGALLAIGYTKSMTAAVASAPSSLQSVDTTSVQQSLEKSFAGAASVAKAYPQYATQVTSAAKTAFMAGADLAYIAGIAAVVAGAALVYFAYPKKDREDELLAEYHKADMG
jgi:MFS transporter, DHA2 family, multidrug resistance protein